MDDISSEVTLKAAALLTFAGGVILCFFGFRLLKVAVGVVGFVLGASLATGLVAVVSEGARSASLIALVVGGLLGALILVWALKVGMFLVGALAGALVAGPFVADLETVFQVLAILGAALVGGLAALKLQRVVLGLSTAIVGAALMISAGLEVLVGVDRARALLERVSSGLGELRTEGWIVLACWLALAAAGAAVQLGTKKKG